MGVALTANDAMVTGFTPLKFTKEFLDGVAEDVHLNDAAVVQGNEFNTTGALLM